MPPFSLLHEAWIPVSTSRGERTLIRLDEIARPDLVAIATGRPDCDISLTEFLIGLLAVACPPQSDEDWRDGLGGAPPSADQLRAAFAPLAEALVLDGDGPRFFQDREELTGEATEVEALCMDVVAKHFTKPGRIATLSRAGGAIVLATLQTSAPSGGAGHRVSVRGGGPLSTLVVPGGDPCEYELWRLLWANLPLAEEDPPELKKVFPWLAPTRVSDKTGRSTTPVDVHRLQAFFGMPRRIRLVFEPNTEGRRCDLTGLVDDVIITHYITRPWGTNYEGWSRGHPLSPYYKQKPSDAAFLPLHLKSSRVGYREWLGISLGQADQTRVPAQCVHDFRRRLQGHTKGDLATFRRDARLLVAGYAMDNMKPLDFGEALMPLIVASSNATNDNLRNLAERLIAAAQETAGLLLGAVKLGLFGAGAKPETASTVLAPVRDRFWADTEQPFFAALGTALEKADAITARDEDEAREAWRDISAAIGTDWLRTLRQNAERIFDDTVSLDDADGRRISDVVQARRQMLVSLSGFGAPGKRIFKALNIPEPETKKPKADKSRKETTA